ncbi:MAG TPA: hypothetical protein DDX54_02410 [Rhodospirillaceae bacterium]|jgi:diguanylate cyclase (GGDEF)-like protein|nr:diguanylate cyclase [Alphaproteobacteria bacterium]HBH26237.1 hypothetical protein [Rhodospirillaceae bacterium]
MQHRLQDAHSDKRMAALMRVQADYAVWFCAVTEAAFYGTSAEAPDPPRSFGLWMQAAQMERILHPKRINRAKAAAHKTQQAAQALVSGPRDDAGRPTQEAFSAFTGAMEGLREHMRTLIRISVLEDHGIDHLTGLYSTHAMHAALKVELDRLARRGQSFVLALACIDNYPLIASGLGDAGEARAMRAVASAVRRTLRVYDDGYRSGNGEFVLCLKEADIHAGTAAMDRLHGAVARAGVSFAVPERAAPLPLTITSCLLAPLPGDSLEEILKALRHDLDTSGQEPGSVLAHHEISPLERALQDHAEGGG